MNVDESEKKLYMLNQQKQMKDAFKNLMIKIN